MNENSQNDFEVIQGNSYRGSRYSNFTGGGLDEQGNASAAANENEQNSFDISTGANQQQIQNPTIAGAEPISQDRVIAPISQSTSGLVRNAVGAVGQAAGISGASILGGQTGGLLGGAVGAGSSSAGAGVTAASASTNFASSAGTSFPSTFGGSTGSSGIPGVSGAAGEGITSAAVTLFQGGSVKEAAVNGLSTYGGSKAGAAIGTAIAPGVGTAVGAAIGAIVGGFAAALGFSKKPSNKGQTREINLNDSSIDSSGQTGKKFSQRNSDFADQVSQSTLDLVGRLKDYGATNFSSLKLNVGSRDGLRVDGKNYGFNSNNFISGINKNVINGSSGLSSEARSALTSLKDYSYDSINNTFNTIRNNNYTAPTTGLTGRFSFQG